MLNRYLKEEITADLKEKMVFLGGPRQVGKTTFSKGIGSSQFKNLSYYNWDYKPDRMAILKDQWPSQFDLLILDEIHKYKKWKNLVKGIYDKNKADSTILVTGSARLNIYRKGGDSLQGRYHYYCMHPFSLAEVAKQKNKLVPFAKLNFQTTEKSCDILNRLLKFGGFPEPFIAQDEKTLRRWQMERIERLFKEDIRDIEIIRDLGSMELLSSLLPEKAAGLLSINSLREDLEVSFKAVANWISLLEKFYYHYRIYPFYSRKIRSLKKEPKLYLWDWSEVKDESRRFENLVAGHLLKLVHYLHDALGYKAELYYLRDVDGREVDFLVTIDRKPWFAVEVKKQDDKAAQNLKYFEERLKIPYLFQVILTSDTDKLINGVRLISADKFLGGLI